MTISKQIPKGIKELDEWCRLHNRSIKSSHGQLKGFSSDSYEVGVV